MKTAQLIPFSPAQTDSLGGCAISVTLARANHDISAEFTLRGDTSSIHWPKPLESAEQGHDLWKHTCFELFLAKPGKPEYWEYNFAPSRQWAIYVFKDYRQAGALPATHTPSIEPPRLSNTTFDMHVRFGLEAPLINQRLVIGVAAVIETCDGRRHYFALRHCGDKPDFHLRECFVLEVD